MDNQHKKEFAELMRATLGIYDKEITTETLVIWWNALKSYSIDVVREALSRHVQDKDRGRFAPKPADLIAMIDILMPDGRPGADEAWAMYPHDEAVSAVITDEMAEAMRIADPLLKEGDKTGARMAFKEAYNRLIFEAKSVNKPVRWFASLGHDSEGRELALNEAVRLGRLSHEHAQGLLPAPKNGGYVENLLGDMKLLTVSQELTEEQKQKNRQRLAGIKAMLKGKAA